MRTTVYKQQSNNPSVFNHSHNCDTFLEISESAINHNIAYYKNHIGLNNALALVIKGNAYGHGLIPMGSIAQKNEFVDWLCVAHYAEGLNLIKAGITKNILILGYATLDSEFHFFNNIHFMVDTIEYASYLNGIGRLYSHQFHVHIKIDTGLSRLGIKPSNTINFIQQLNKLSHIKIAGIFSHFIASDSNEIVTNKQFKLFAQLIESFLYSYPHISHIHMSNTASTTTIDYPSFFNFFRIGLGVYGFSHNNDASLKPALTWKTHVSGIKTVPAGSYVSYACTYKTKRVTRIALLPVGYSDGYQLRFSNKSSVFINNTIAPVIGRVGMNITIIDVTDCKAAINDEVILLGDVPYVRVTDIAKAADIYNVREIFTGINPAITRIVTI